MCGKQEDTHCADTHENAAIAQSGIQCFPYAVEQFSPVILGHNGQCCCIEAHRGKQGNLLNTGGNPVGCHSFFTKLTDEIGDHKYPYAHGDHV